MSRLPVVSGKELVRAFEEDDWVATRQHGSHMILTKDGRRETLAVQLHRELAPGTLRSLLRAARISVEELRRLL